MYGLFPHYEGPFPILAFMHGDACGWEMYQKMLEHYASHGFIVVFPFISSPKADWHHYVTELDGTVLMKSVQWALEQNETEGSPLYGKVDPDTIIYSGHSMGGYGSIEASHTEIDNEAVKLTLSFHPGGCDHNKYAEVAKKHPVVLTMSSNDPLAHNDFNKCFEPALDAAG